MFDPISDRFYCNISVQIISTNDSLHYNKFYKHPPPQPAHQPVRTADSFCLVLSSKLSHSPEFPPCGARTSPASFEVRPALVEVARMIGWNFHSDNQSDLLGATT